MVKRQTTGHEEEEIVVWTYVKFRFEEEKVYSYSST
jgi:hypothetical protein